jgi:hypothetical protein
MVRGPRPLEGFQGGLSAGNYATITGASPATTTRDLADLVEKGELRGTGERRHARYFLELPVRSRPGPWPETYVIALYWIIDFPVSRPGFSLRSELFSVWKPFTPVASSARC